jgi:hypothetical protein
MLALAQVATSTPRMIVALVTVAFDMEESLFSLSLSTSISRVETLVSLFEFPTTWKILAGRVGETCSSSSTLTCIVGAAGKGFECGTEILDEKEKAGAAFCEDQFCLCGNSCGLDGPVGGKIIRVSVEIDDELNDDASEFSAMTADPETEENKESDQVAISEKASCPRDKRGNPTDVRRLFAAMVAALEGKDPTGEGRCT